MQSITGKDTSLACNFLVFALSDSYKVKNVTESVKVEFIFSILKRVQLIIINITNNNNKTYQNKDFHVKWAAQIIFFNGITSQWQVVWDSNVETTSITVTLQLPALERIPKEAPCCSYIKLYLKNIYSCNN